MISKTQIDALLAVFVKVFDEMCGYYGKQGHIAQFERDLDGRGLYGKFQSAYEGIAGRLWKEGREQALLESKNIADAYAEVSGDDPASAMGILDRYRAEYHVSIEDFAERIRAWIDRQGPDFRLNFFVDEVGQYIADNVKLMTNLQTIAESLATKCRGRAWIVVTSQNEMSLIIGEMNRGQRNDFSKITDRFLTKMLLTSTNVAEVIQKRLLPKTDAGAEELRNLYAAESNNFGTLFGFGDGARSYRPYKDEADFIATYPFVPYQFELFQSAIENLSRHNAFEGRHSSVGERSMLGVFQQVVVKIRDYEIGQLATFDLMFEGIQTALKAQTQRAILAAQRQLGDVFALKVLKALFIVKYVKEFKATARNLCVLMLAGFRQDLAGLRRDVEEALNLLEQETYIQRAGEVCEYLTDEEKDVEQEIKETDVEPADVAEELEKILFDHVIRTRKIRHAETKQDYPFSRKLDDRLYGREYELAIHLVTPLHENAEDEFILQSRSLGRDELLVVLPPDARLVSDGYMYKRTEKYIGRNISATQRDTVKRILEGKRLRNQELYAELQQRVKDLLAQAKFYVAGTPAEVRGEDAQARIVRAFHELVNRTYPNLRMLRGVFYTENDIAGCLDRSKDGLFGTDAAGLAESEQEVLAFIRGNQRGGVRTTLKSLVERFERKPYGWPYAALLCTLANLCARARVEVKNDGDLLEGDGLEKALRNTRGHGNLVLEPQVEFTASQVRGLKEFYADFFDEPPPPGEAKVLGMAAAHALQKRVEKLKELVRQEDRYPFLNGLKPVLERLEGIAGKPYAWYLTELSRQEDDLLDMKENLIDPILRFMAGPQKRIYDDAREFVRAQEPNFGYIGDAGPEDSGVREPGAKLPKPADLAEALTDPECFRGNRMQEIKGLVDTLAGAVNARIEAEIQKAGDAVSALKERLCGMAEFGALTPEQQAEIVGPFDLFPEKVQNQELIAVVRDTLRRFEETDYQRLVSQVVEWAEAGRVEPVPVSIKGEKTGEGEDFGSAGKREEKGEEKEKKPLPRVESVPIREVRVSFDKAWIADEADVEKYVEAMRDALLAEIGKGRRIHI